jgi:hypothetical protein
MERNASIRRMAMVLPVRLAVSETLWRSRSRERAVGYDQSMSTDGGETG